MDHESGLGTPWPPIPPKRPPLDSQFGARFGRASLIGGLAACCGESMIVLADLGHLPRVVKLGGLTTVVVSAMWIFAVAGGMIAALCWWSLQGCLAAVTCLVFAVAVIAFLLLGGGFWLD